MLCLHHQLTSCFAGIRHFVYLFLLVCLPALPHRLVQTVVAALVLHAVRLLFLLFHILLAHYHVLTARFGLAARTRPVSFGLIVGAHIDAIERLSEERIFEGVAGFAGA